MISQPVHLRSVLPRLGYCGGLAAVVLLNVLLSGVGQAQTPAGEIAKLREQIAAQQKQLDEQRRALDAAQATLNAQQKMLDRLAAAPGAAPSAAAALAVPAAAPATPAVVTAAEVDPKGRPISPLAFHIGGADFTPGGFMDFATAWRSANIGSGVATSFSALPLGNTAAGRMSEYRSSAANSRITLTITENPTKRLSLTGYLEADFSGNQPTSMYVTSNSSTLRMRHFWVNAQQGKWEVLGGQTWTLMTPNRVGVSQVSSNVFVGLGEDSNYLAGLVWGRPGQLRSVAAAVENPEQFVTSATTLPAFAAAQVGNGSAVSTPNVRPDITAKVAYDTTVSGKALHFELAGVSRQFRTSPAQGTYFNKQGFGGSVGTVLEVAKNFRLIGTSFYSSGGGRLIVGLGPDFVVGPDGSISPVHSMSANAGLEYAPTAKSQFFAYYSGSYFRRNYTVLAPGSYLGFGFPGSSAAASRQYQEPTFGYYYTWWKNPRYGALQAIGQYAYLTRAPWYAAPGTPTTGHANMIFGSLRFTLP